MERGELPLSEEEWLAKVKCDMEKVEEKKK
jgi:hypothetical protein